MSVICWAGAGQYPLSPSQYFMLAGAHAHSAWHTTTEREMKVSAYFTSVHIASFGRTVTGKRESSDVSEKEVYT